MKICALEIENFGAIASLSLSSLPDAVVIAGINGCGKSQIFHALRLLKSTYGEYQPNEFKKWFGEFQIDWKNREENVLSLFRDRNKHVLIRAELALSAPEKKYIREHGFDIIHKSIWKERFPKMDLDESDDTQNVSFARAKRMYGKGIEEKANSELKAVLDVLQNDTFVGQIIIYPNGSIEPHPSPVLELIFSTYDPENLGVVDYHGAHRRYAREKVGNLSLKANRSSHNFAQHALYNWEQKYSNIKSELSQTFVQNLIAELVGAEVEEDNTLTEVLQELFATFFPTKEFLGPQFKDGNLRFPVRLASGLEHDINELSSGEKEVLYGYLRLRSSAPRNSVILLDEPELHLNPRLIRGLPRFYQKHIGKALDNQLWMITHSDALLREALEEPAFAVYHMQPALDIGSEDNQLHVVEATAEVERAVMDLVGDLATYSPRSKVVILEGGGDSKFDERFVTELFPTFSERVNLISAGNKKAVHELHELLNATAEKGVLGARFFSIVDRDFDGPELSAVESRHQWDVYHIENYLLNSTFIKRALHNLSLGEISPLEPEIEKELKMVARETIGAMVKIKLVKFIDQALVGCIKIGADPKLSSFSGPLRLSAETSVARLQKVLEESLSVDELKAKEAQVKQELEDALENNEWKRVFRGRDVLSLFNGNTGLRAPYEFFRNAIINEMRVAQYQPPGMKDVIEAILNE